MTTPLKDALDAAIEEAALAYAHKWRLVADDGTVWCATDRCERLALLPGLHCPACLAAAWRRLNVTQPSCPNREQQPKVRAAGA